MNPAQVRSHAITAHNRHGPRPSMRPFAVGARLSETTLATVDKGNDNTAVPIRGGF